MKKWGAEREAETSGECEIERGYGLGSDPDFKYGL